MTCNGMVSYVMGWVAMVWHGIVRYWYEMVWNCIVGQIAIFEIILKKVTDNMSEKMTTRQAIASKKPKVHNFDL